MQNGLFADKGDVVIVKRDDPTHPWKVITSDTSDVPSHQTGWCKTRSHCERQVEKLIVEGWNFIGEIDTSTADSETLTALRLSPFGYQELKSAVQKYIRRGFVQEAVDCAFSIMGDKSGVSWMIRRMPIFMAEDVGWVYLSRLTPGWWETETGILDMVAMLAAVPKNKEAGWLYTMAMGVTPSNDLETLILEGDHIGATAAAIAAHQTRQIIPIKNAAARWGTANEQIASAALSRSYQGGMEGDIKMLVASAVLSAVDEELPLRPMTYVYNEPAVTQTLHWWTQDSHTWRGKAAIKRTDHHGLSNEQFGEVWFFAESAKLNPIDPATRWTDEALDKACRAETGLDGYDAAVAYWVTKREEVARYVQFTIDRDSGASIS